MIYASGFIYTEKGLWALFMGQLTMGASFVAQELSASAYQNSLPLLLALYISDQVQASVFAATHYRILTKMLTLLTVQRKGSNTWYPARGTHRDGSLVRGGRRQSPREPLRLSCQFWTVPHPRHLQSALQPVCSRLHGVWRNVSR